MLSSNFLAMIRSLRVPGSPQFPIDVFPSRSTQLPFAPPCCSRAGATGKLNVVVGRLAHDIDSLGTGDAHIHGSCRNPSNP